jgi:transcriptional regulator with XRE-family HTH domain
MRDSLLNAAALNTLREEAGMSMAELARRAGVSYSYMKYLAYGQRQPTDTCAFAIANALECHPDDFSIDKKTGLPIPASRRRTRRRNRARTTRKEAA